MSETLHFLDDVRPEDPGAVRAVVESSGFFYADEVDIAVELVQDRVDKGENSDYHFVFARRPDGEILGYTCYGFIAGTQESFDLYWIAVREKARHEGIGKRLMLETERRIAQRGGRRVYIETSSRDLYTPTREFYLRCEYQVEATLTDFYRPGDAKVIFVKALGDPAAGTGAGMAG